MDYHVPVLFDQCIDGLDIKENGVYVDVTFGGGGHSRGILSKLGEKGRLFAFDQDEDALLNSIDDPRFKLINVNFRHFKKYLKLHGVSKVDGILADLGVSSHQFDVAERGFSIRFDAELDMRMNQSANLSAFEVVNDYELDELLRVFRDFGELKNAWKIANKIIEQREQEPIKRNGELMDLLKPYAPRNKENRFFAQVFQAIRIEVNDEMQVLKEFLQGSLDMLSDGGRLVVISYHSLEDRLVKRFVKSGLFHGEPEKDIYGYFYKPFSAVNRKVIVPSDEEINQNNRARSAKLRIAKREYEK
jgi:16S rRNA (cytosine1402-N4)-methyltransferase